MCKNMGGGGGVSTKMERQTDNGRSQREGVRGGVLSAGEKFNNNNHEFHKFPVEISPLVHLEFL